jgi:hypothetical protein
MDEVMREAREIVLLYNDRDRESVRAIYAELSALLPDGGFIPWMAAVDLTAFGDLFEQIEGRIHGAAAVVVFLGRQGLGRFQQNIEMGAVSTELWQKGSAYGALLVHLEAGVTVPIRLLRWPSVNHDGRTLGPRQLATEIVSRLGL